MLIEEGREVPSGARIETSKALRSSSGTKFFPITMNIGTMAITTTIHTSTTSFRCAIDQRNIPA